MSLRVETFKPVFAYVQHLIDKLEFAVCDSEVYIAPGSGCGSINNGRCHQMIAFGFIINEIVVSGKFAAFARSGLGDF